MRSTATEIKPLSLYGIKDEIKTMYEAALEFKASFNLPCLKSSTKTSTLTMHEENAAF